MRLRSGEHVPATHEGKLFFSKDIVDDSFVPRSLNPFQNLKPSLLRGVPQRASMCHCSR